MNKRFVLPVLVLSQFCGTSLWFAGNSALPQLQSMHNWSPGALGNLVSSVQLGFIAGTLVVALSGITDKYSPSRIFFISSWLGAFSNLVGLFDLSSENLMLASRLSTGFFLAGIYPVGMKIAADWREQGLGFWLSSLVGALVLGTSFPFALKLIPGEVNSELIFVTVSALSALGGILLLAFVGDGPFRKPASRFSFSDVRAVFRNTPFRAAACGYFGHMWELYAFWAFVPWLLNTYNLLNGESISVNLWSFAIIGCGFFGCYFGGVVSRKVGSSKVAYFALATSGICCLLSPLFFLLSPEVFLIILFVWGAMVVADSPQFSALIAQNASPEVKGSSITIATCIGFSITIISIQVLHFMQDVVPNTLLLTLLFPGPAIGLILLSKK